LSAVLAGAALAASLGPASTRLDSAAAEPIAPATTAAPVGDRERNTLPTYLGPLPRMRRQGNAADAPPHRGAGVPLSGAAQLIAHVRNGHADVPRIELAARLRVGGFDQTSEFQQLRENAAREIAGRPDEMGAVDKRELEEADREIAREVAVLQGTTPGRSFRDVAKAAGRPQIAGLRIVYLHPLGRLADANHWRNIIAHQTEGPAGSARALALAQAKNPTKRGVTLWVETDGTVYWSTAEHAIPTHGDGANRNDNKYVDNSQTYRTVVRTNSLGVEFVGNFPDVAKAVTAEQVSAWLILVQFLQERYDIPPERIYAHNWIDYKDRRYCEGCELGTLARRLAYQPGRSP
jgi:hypothetical protein